MGTLGKVGHITSKIDDLKIHLSWESPLNNDIITYIVMIKAASGRFRALTENCDETKNSRMCSFPLEILKKSPFFLEYGEEIEIKITPYNNYGLGKPAKSTVGKFKRYN